MKITTPWIYSPRFDLIAIIGPSVAVTSMVWIFGDRIASVQSIPWWLWVVLVLGIDVAHVYSSLFRTYFDKEEFQRRRKLYVWVPILCWALGSAIYFALGAGVFWAIVTYAAIYHFVRQQYGFMMLYRRGDSTRDWKYRVDQVSIYLATIYPLVYWHTYARNFQWFEAFELPKIPWTFPEQILRFIYISCLVLYCVKEWIEYRQTGCFNLGKTLLLVATGFSWATGIIFFNADLTFTLINIVSHGLPYLALVWIYQHRRLKKSNESKKPFLRFFQPKLIPLYLGVLFALAYFEEGIWDWFVWKEHPNIFGDVQFSVSPWTLTVLVPLLIMPQMTHYILDAFIWRVNKPGKEEVRSALG